jgi:hypothetical protein
MVIERRVLKSISEFSMFKYFLVFYLLFFILSIIVMVVIGLFAWLGLHSAGFDINSIFSSLGMEKLDISRYFGGGMAVTIAVMVVGGLVASVVYAVVAVIMVWIINVVLKISGGIELRFLSDNKEQLKIKEAE